MTLHVRSGTILTNQLDDTCSYETPAGASVVADRNGVLVVRACAGVELEVE
jgi:hypothetical protein